MQLSDFDFNLPKELIAQEPPTPRGSSRLLYVNNGSVSDKYFTDVISLMNREDVIVFNDTKVIPCLFQIYQVNGASTSVKITLVKQITSVIWQIMAKPANRLNIGDIITFSTDGILCAKVLEKKIETNYMTVEFLNIAHDELLTQIVSHGNMPLPPYIKRSDVRKSDFIDYQTIYSKTYGAVAAPTAGLHFTDELLNKIRNKGIITCFLTLHVGLGTFLPITTEQIDDHKMHSEYFTISQETCNIINNAKTRGKRIIAVGTTSVRVLESVAKKQKLYPTTGETSIFIKSIDQFQIVDALITNFHLPKSTLLILTSAFAGYNAIKNAYSHAVANQYKFFSYGDACFLEKQKISQ